MAPNARAYGPMIRILTFVPYYLPGYRAGGPLRSISNLVDHLSSEFAFSIVTLDRDAESDTPYPGVAVNAWNAVGNARVYYAAPNNLGLSRLGRLMRATPHDIVYLNSFFHPRFTVIPLLLQKLGRVPSSPTIVAPKGQFSEGALALKRTKKSAFLKAAALTRLYSDVLWQASSVYEADDVKRVMGVSDTPIIVAPDLLPRMPPAVPSDQTQRGAPRTRENPLRMIFLSRITPKKNLDFALRALSRVRVPVELSIVGPIRDEAYWKECRGLMDDLPDHIRARHLGSVEHGEVHALMVDHDLLFLPTHGENYGHVVPEALVAGTPVLISDTTPWRNLESRGVGWDLPLDDEEAFVAAIEAAARLSAEDFARFRRRAYDYGVATRTDPDAVRRNRFLFLKAAGIEEARSALPSETCFE